MPKNKNILRSKTESLSKRKHVKSKAKGASSSDKSDYKTLSGLEIKECYFASDLPKKSIALKSKPGSYPYTRGIHKNMYRGKLWTMRQYAGFGTAKEGNERFHYLLSKGTTGLSVAFDLPTQMGRDSDHALSRGEVGRVGVAISSLEDMEQLLEGIPLDKVSISMTINSTASILLAFLLVVAERRGVTWDKLSGTVQNDILKEYIARGTYVFPPKHALRLVVDLISFCRKHVPRWNTISISGYHIREAGSNAVQEIAFTFANAITYVQAALDSGLRIDDFAPRLAFFFNCHNDFFEEVAKFRAARTIWAEIMKKRFKAKKPESMMLRFHTQTAGSSLTAQQPLNNIVRTTIQAMAAVIGGTQSLHTNSYDEALGLPTKESSSIALRTQQIIAHESGLASSVDPLAGSYLIEAYTKRLREEVFKILALIDKKGGMLKAIEDEYPQREIEKTAYEYQKSIDETERLIVGVNQFADKELTEPEIQKLDPKGELEQNERLKNIRLNRDNHIYKDCKEKLIQAAKSNQNLIPYIVDAAKNNLTLGEISDCLRGVFGEY